MPTRTLLIFLLVMSSCQDCGTIGLDDTRCRPGNPAIGSYDDALVERCDNDIDDNCDGQINEGCSCKDGDVQLCGVDLGECESGSVVCKDGTWPVCFPKTVPTTEVCNGLDDNCDGQVDEIDPVECWDGPSPDAGMIGACTKGVRSCVDGHPSECVGQVSPSVELCNGLDDDCDGLTDETPVGDNQFCGPEHPTGVCVRGQKHCFGGEFICIGARYPTAEECNGVDDDCDGLTDEDLYHRCDTACGSGVEVCENAQWANCDAQQPALEICNQLDDDCDGDIDEGLTCPCTVGEVTQCTSGIVDESGEPLACGAGLRRCLPPGIPGPCKFFDTIDELCDNWDNDCDGVVDDFSSICAEQLAGIGVCKAGLHHCTSGHWSDVCEGAVGPTSEICNQLDDDCDGETDENLNKHTKVDMVFAVDISGSMGDEIIALRNAIARYSQSFVGTEHRFALIVFPGEYHDPLKLIVNLSTVEDFEASLATLSANGGGQEPSYDVLYQIVSPENSIGLTWRSDAYPYVVLIGDEEAQTYVNTTEHAVSYLTSSCLLPGCRLGDKVEIFVIIQLTYSSMYDDIVYNEARRMIEIEPPEEERYVSVLRDVFSEVCVPPPPATP